METLFSVSTVFFTVIGYPMSYIEFFGTMLSIACVWLTAKNRIISWPIGILGTILFGFLFYQIQLYADFFEQIYFLITGFWGWWAWSKVAKESPDKSTVYSTSKDARAKWILVIIMGTAVLGYLTAHLHLFFPQFFTIPASLPYLDAFTTVLSFVATILLVRKEVDAWYIWILVDIIGIGLYWYKDVRLVSLLYIVFLILAIKGLMSWSKLRKSKVLTN